MKLAPDPGFVVFTVPAPPGNAGIFTTVRAMRALIDEGKAQPDITQAATSIIYLQPEMNDAAEAGAIFNYVRDTVRYQRDPVGLESVTQPRITLLRQVGDCDDQTTLLGAMLEAVGYPTRLVVAGYDGEDYSHVYLQVMVNGDWIDADPTQREPLGYAPPMPSKLWIERR